MQTLFHNLGVYPIKELYMKTLISFLSILLFLGIFLLSGCGIDDDNGACLCPDEGIITERDYRKCGCCGGWFIKIKGDTLRAPTLPQSFSESLDDNEFPLPVKLNWKHEKDPCLGDEIEVDCIKRQ